MDTAVAAVAVAVAETANNTTITSTAADTAVAADITDRPHDDQPVVGIDEKSLPLPSSRPVDEQLSTAIGATTGLKLQQRTADDDVTVGAATIMLMSHPLSPAIQVDNTVSNVVAAAKATINGHHNDGDDRIDAGDGDDEEKCDADPENSRKSCDITPDTSDEISLSVAADTTPEGADTTSTPSATTEQPDPEQSPSKSAMAFTIDFDDARAVNSKKYNDIFERFQRRHRRGASMSKLDDGTATVQTPAPTVVATATVRGKTPLRKAASTVTPKQVVADGKVRLRDKSRLSRRDGSCGPENRHSWSPRNSSVQPTGGRATAEEAPPVVVQPLPARLQQQRKLSADHLLSTATAPVAASPPTFQPKSATLQRAFETIKCNFELNHQRTTTNAISDADIACIAPPLEFRPACRSTTSEVSEAGTYTLDGDNYTEEQKEQMSIDKLAKLSLKTTDTATTISPSVEQQPQLEQPLQLKPAKTKPTSYLERIKSKVRNISDRTFHPHQHNHKQAALVDVELPPQMSQYSSKQQPPSTLDLGNFTSITSAGAFSKPAASGGSQQHHHHHARKPSLSKSQIDNAEYIQHAGVAAAEALTMCSFTDYEKARQHADYQLSMAPPSASSPSAGLERAETKNDWIQEWAKNARRNTKKTAAAAAASLETTCGGTSTGIATNANNSSSDYSDINQQSSAAAHRRQMLVYHAQEANRYADDLQRYDRRSRQSASPAQRRRPLPGATATTTMTASSTSHSEFGDLDDDEDDDRSTSPPPQPQHHHHHNDEYYAYGGSAHVSRPPVSPSKIPSPMHSLALSRPRSSSVNRSNRSLHSSITDLDSMRHHHNDDTGMYLHKTAAAISQLQHIHRQRSAGSPQQSPSSPQHGKIASNFMTSPSVRRHYKHSPFATLSPEQQQAAVAARPPHAVHSSPQHSRSGYAQHHGSSTSLHQQQYQQQQQQFQQQQLQQQQQRNHRRNHSLDNAEPLSSVGRSTVYRNEAMSHSYNSDGLREALHHNHSRHHSYEHEPSDDGLRSPLARSRVHSIDQTFAPHIVKRTVAAVAAVVVAPSRCDAGNNCNGSSNKVRSKSANVTPATIKRSSSFSTKPFVRPQSGSSVNVKATTSKVQQPSPRPAPALQKSASSNSFKNMSGRYGHHNGGDGGGIYLNDNDNLYAPQCSSESEMSDAPASPGVQTQAAAADVLTNTRYNRAFLARLEQNKPKQQQQQSASASTTSATSSAVKQGGAHACPNTPEMPRRDLRVRQSLRDRASMPRDSSMQRMKQDLVAAGKKSSLVETSRPTPASPASGSGGRVLPKYLDISKYKPQQGNTFLRRDESKSTLIAQHKEIKRSASSFGVGLGRASEAVGRSSVRSVKSATSGHSAGGGGSSSSRPTMVVSKDEATREADLAMWRRRASYDPMKAAAEGKRKLEERKTAHANKYGDSSPSVVLRSQSYHSGVGQSAASSGAGSDRTDAAASKRWTLISTESSEDDDQPQY